MKKVLLFIFALISINLFSQIQVKENSFRKIDGYVMLDKTERLDDNDNPMALIKISTENISLEQRAKFYFKGNLETYFDKHLQEDGQLYLYVSAVAPFMEIIHPEYGKTEYTFPFDLCEFCGYEMVVQYVPLVVNAASEPVQKKKYHLIVKADQSDATIYIDDNPLDIGEASLLVTEGTNHTWKIECNLYHTETGSVTVNERTVVNKTLRPAFGYINISSSPEQGAKVFVDGEYIGLSPIKTDKLKSGTHTVRVMKDMYKMKEQSFTVTDGQTTNATLNMSANFVNVTINTDSQSDIYVDEEYKGKGRWTGRLSDGEHIVEARKANHRASSKAVELVLGETKTITLEAPKPIYGSLEINSSPMNANIYIDGKHYGETPNYINEIIIGSHELKLTKQGCSEIKKTITIKEGETLSVNEKLQTGKEISISTDKSGDKIYVGNYIGISPIASTLSYGSCPDTDGDGVMDKYDKCPEEPGAIENDGCPIYVPVEFAKNIGFESGKATLTQDSYQYLDQLVQIMKDDANCWVKLDGHTDNTGSDKINQKLSQDRVDAIKYYLVDNGIDPNRIIARGHGPSKPIADNKTAEGRAKNRRVEINIAH